MYLYVVLLSKFRHIVNCLMEEFHIVVVEWSGDLVQVLYCIDIQHNILFCVPECHGVLQNQGKTVAKIAKKSVFSQYDID